MKFVRLFFYQKPFFLDKKKNEPVCSKVSKDSKNSKKMRSQKSEEHKFVLKLIEVLVH